MNRCAVLVASFFLAIYFPVTVKAQESAVSELSKGEPAMGEKVLRHAVYLAFKESTVDSDVNAVVDQFASLEQEIPSIIDFEMGVNNSPENLDDGFTHCFLVTFADVKGLQSYLAHPGHVGLVTKATPFAANMFVMDYFGERDDSSKKQLRHAVFFKFKDDATQQQIAKVTQAFASLPKKIDVIKGFEQGTNLKAGPYDHGFTHCFLLTFDSEAGRAKYLPHPDHKAFGQLLRPVLDKVRVLDYWTGN